MRGACWLAEGLRREGVDAARERVGKRGDPLRLGGSVRAVAVGQPAYGAGDACAHGVGENVLLYQ